MIKMAVGIKDYSMPSNGREDDGKVGGGPPPGGLQTLSVEAQPVKMRKV